MKNTNGTVTISIKEFDDLRNFKSTIESGGAVRIYASYGGEEYIFFYNKDEALNVFAATNESLNRQIEGLKKQPNKELESIKKMSIWQFLKWRDK